MDRRPPGSCAYTVANDIQREPMKDTDKIRILHELIAALDRRLPQMHGAGEASIAREAAALKVSALERVATLEHKLRSV
jgi:Trp operon repressor